MKDRIDVKILGAGANWTGLGGRISIGLDGYYSRLPKGSTVATVTMNPAAACYEGILRVADGTYHMAITTPGWFARLALEGLDPFEKSIPLRALAQFPHDDRMAFAVRRDRGVKSLADLGARKYPLKVSTPEPGSWHPAVWGAQEILREYGYSYEDILKWGGRMLADRPRFVNDPAAPLISEDFDAVFDEALMTRRWKRLTDQYDLDFLPIDEGVMRKLEQRGFARGKIEKGRFRGIDQDIPAIDFSGWLLYCHEDMDEELAYLTIAAIEEQKKEIEKIFPQPHAALTGPVDLHKLATDPAIPLHKGAERYYREFGHI